MYDWTHYVTVSAAILRFMDKGACPKEKEACNEEQRDLPTVRDKGSGYCGPLQ